MTVRVTLTNGTTVFVAGGTKVEGGEMTGSSYAAIVVKDGANKVLGEFRSSEIAGYSIED
jgi:hypothetical protein